jgi:hypothetical protein
MSLRILAALAFAFLSPQDDPTLASLRAEARRIEPLLGTDAASELLRHVDALPAIEAHTVSYVRSDGQEAELQVDTARFYHTFYGTPLAALRAYDVAAARGIETYRGRRILEFGYGSVGQLWLLAAAGADVVGIEVSAALEALYGDHMVFRVEGDAGSGRCELFFGRWPTDELRESVGGGFDLFLSKNVIKRGYVAPPESAGIAPELDFGVPAEDFLRRVRECLAPGGLALFYNLGGAPAAEGERYRPATDIASPWDRAAYETAGFEVLELDADDTAVARRCARAFGWDGPPFSMELERDLFARYTLLRRPRG